MSLQVGITETQSPQAYDNTLSVGLACTEAAPPDVPVASMNFVSTPSAIIVQWTQGAEPDTNQVWRSQNGGAYSQIAEVDGAILEYDDNDGIGPGDIWCYKVRGVLGGVESEFSNVVCAVKDLYFPSVGAISHPTWVMAFGDFGGDDNTQMTSLSLSGLKRVTGTLYLDVGFNLTSLNLDALQILDSSIFLSQASILTTVNLPALTTISGNLYFDACPALVNVSMPLLQYQNGKSYFFDTGALSAASIEGILARAVASGVVSATLRFDGGTSAGLASLSAQAQADYATLLAAGNTLSINA